MRNYSFGRNLGTYGPIDLNLNHIICNTGGQCAPFKHPQAHKRSYSNKGVDFLVHVLGTQMAPRNYDYVCQIIYS